jgi:hypothetical protein
MKRLGFASATWLRVGREGAWVLFGQLSTALAGLVGVRVLTELAPREVFGQVTLLLGMLALGRNMLVAPVTNAQIRMHPDFAAAGRLAWFTRSLSQMSWRATGLFALLFTIGYIIWRLITGGGVRPMLLVPLLGLIALETAKGLRINRLSSDRMQRQVGLWVGIEAWLMMACSALGLLVAKTPETYLAGQLIASLMVLGIFGVLLYPGVPADRPGATGIGEPELQKRVRL